MKRSIYTLCTCGQITFATIFFRGIQPKCRLSVLCMRLSPITNTRFGSVRSIRLIISLPLYCAMITSPGCMALRQRAAMTSFPCSRRGIILVPTTRRTSTGRLSFFSLPKNFCNCIDHLHQLLAFLRLRMMLTLACLLRRFPYEIV